MLIYVFCWIRLRCKLDLLIIYLAVSLDLLILYINCILLRYNFNIVEQFIELWEVASFIELWEVVLNQGGNATTQKMAINSL